MGTKNDGGSASRKSGRANRKSTQTQPQKASGPAGASAQTTIPPAEPAQPGTPGASSSPGTIHKGVYLSALIYVEGDQAPAADFNSLAISTLKKGLGDCFTSAHDGLNMSLKSVNVKNNVEDEDQGEKFQF